MSNEDIPYPRGFRVAWEVAWEAPDWVGKTSTLRFQVDLIRRDRKHRNQRRPWEEWDVVVEALHRHPILDTAVVLLPVRVEDGAFVMVLRRHLDLEWDVVDLLLRTDTEVLLQIVTAVLQTIANAHAIFPIEMAVDSIAVIGVIKEAIK
jgi:hypothetical protein